MIRADSLSLFYGEREVLKNLTFQVENGETLVIMGTSGGGKSSLLKCLAGILVPTSGKVIIEGIIAHNAPEKAAERAGFVFQGAALFDSITIWENVTFGLKRQQKLSKKELKEKATYFLNLVGLYQIENLYPSQLSGGMQKRVGLARALSFNPTVLFYDEPTSGLDPITTYNIDKLIADTSKNLKVTSLVVTHDVKSATRIADRVLFLNEGKIEFVGTIQEMHNTTHPMLKKFIDMGETSTLQLS